MTMAPRTVRCALSFGIGRRVKITAGPKATKRGTVVSALCAGARAGYVVSLDRGGQVRAAESAVEALTEAIPA